MGAVSVKSTAITNADQLYPRVASPPYLTKGALFCAAGTLEVGVGDTAGSIYRFVRVSSGARIHRMDLFSDAMSGFTSASIGLYRPQDSAGTAGTVVNASLFGASIDLTAAQTEPYDVIFNNLGIENVEKRVWELLGLTQDPFLFYDIAVTSVTQSGAAGTLSMRVDFTV